MGYISKSLKQIFGGIFLILSTFAMYGATYEIVLNTDKIAQQYGSFYSLTSVATAVPMAIIFTPLLSRGYELLVSGVRNLRNKTENE
jgi:hypothetical protein